MTTDDRLGPPPIEPLSDVAWARVERGLWARMDGSVTTQIEPPASRRWWIAVPIVAAAAVIALLVIKREPARVPEVVDRGSDTSDVRVVAPPNAPTAASFNDAHIELAPASAVVMRHDRPITVLERGEAWFAVAPRGERPPFVVLAGDATVRVIGTRFRVARHEDRVTVEVDHGAVEVTFRGEREVVRDRQTWSSDHPDQVASRTVVVPPEPAPKAESKPAPKPESKPAPKPESKPEPKKIEPRSDDAADQAMFERLSVLERKNPQAAMTGYLELSQRSGRWAANGLFAAGRLAADRNDPKAATLLTVYLRRFPSGANVDDARALLSRLPAPKGDSR